MAKCLIRPATAADALEFWGSLPPSEVWIGMVAEREGVIVGFGVVVWDALGQAWGYFDQRGVNRFVMYRTARRVMDALKAAGEPAMWAHCDRGIAKAENWLQRLGMQPEPNPHVPGETWVIRWA